MQSLASSSSAAAGRLTAACTSGRPSAQAGHHIGAHPWCQRAWQRHRLSPLAADGGKAAAERAAALLEGVRPDVQAAAKQDGMRGLLPASLLSILKNVDNDDSDASGSNGHHTDSSSNSTSSIGSSSSSSSSSGGSSSSSSSGDGSHGEGEVLVAGGRKDAAWTTVVALSALVAFICSVDRAAISVAILPMSDEYGWSDTTKGAINSAFYVGYTVTNLVGGYLASTLSAKRVLSWGVVVWSIFTVATPLAAGSALPVLLGNRALMGAGEGVTFPAVQNIVKGWVPIDSRTRALALIYSGGQLGTIVALLTAPLIIQAWGWPSVFQLYGSMGLLWMLAWQPLVADTPPFFRQWQPEQQELLQQPSASSSNGSYDSSSGALPATAEPAQQGPSSMPRIQDLPWRQFLTNRSFIAILMAHAAFGVGHYVSLSWLPTYYHQEFGVDLQQAALLSVLPWFVTVIVSNSAAWLADWLANSGTLNMTQTRKLMQGIGSLGPAACLLRLALITDASGELDMGEAVLLLTGTLALGGFQSAGFAANHQDISGKYAAVLFGITNATSSLMGTMSVYATGQILDATGSWDIVFDILAGFYVVGCLAYLSWGSAEQTID